MEYTQIIKEIEEKKFYPIYFLMGEETFFIDKITEHIQTHLHSEQEREMSQSVLYALDTPLDEVIFRCSQPSLFSNDKKLVIVREAQQYGTSKIERLIHYAEKPDTQTILVVNFKHKLIDKRKKLYKTLKGNNSIVFEAKRVYENEMQRWVDIILKTYHLQIEPLAKQVLIDHLGTDLKRMDSEMNKLSILLGKDKTISIDDIEKNIEISKDFNSFEFRKALGSRDKKKAYQIAHYLSNNFKQHPFFLILFSLFSFYTQLMQLHVLKNKNYQNIAKELKINPFFVNDYLNAQQNYSLKQTVQILGFIQRADANAKGLYVKGTTPKDILKELSFKILNC